MVVSFSYLATALTLITGTFFFIFTLKDPRRAWPFSIVAAIIGSGPIVFDLGILDEILIAFPLCAILISLDNRAFKDRQWLFNFRSITSLQRLCFFLLAIYMAWQSLRGILILDDPRKIRWIVFFLELGLLSAFYNQENEWKIERKELAFWITLSSFLYFLFYFLHGWSAEHFRGLTRWDVQTTEWGTSAYAMFPVALAVPGCFVTIREGTRKQQYLGWATLALIALDALFYDSRVTVLVLMGMVVVGLPYLGLRAALKFSLIAVFLYVIFATFIWPKSRDLKFFYEDLFGSGDIVNVTESDKDPNRDIDRRLHLKVMTMSITESWSSLLFGYGYRMSGRIISPYLRQLFLEAGLPDRARKVADDEGTEALTSWVVDGGLVGIFLLLINFILLGWRIFANTKLTLALVLLASLSITFLWMTVINLTDIALFFIAFMPAGLLWTLSQNAEDTVLD